VLKKVEKSARISKTYSSNHKKFMNKNKVDGGLPKVILCIQYPHVKAYFKIQPKEMRTELGYISPCRI